MINKKTGTGSQYDVCIATAHYGEYDVFRKFPRTRVVYDFSDLYDTITDLGLGSKEFEHFPEGNSRDQYLKRIMKRRMDRMEIYDLWNRGNSENADIHATYIELSGTKEDFEEWIKYLGDFIKETVSFPHFGGDDVFFDYFPDLLDIFAQVCFAFDKKHYCLRVLSSPEMEKGYFKAPHCELDINDIPYWGLKEKVEI